MSDWQPEDEVTTTFGSIKQAQMEAYNDGWEDAINYVIDISKQMRYNNPYITPTLEELEQRIV
jgi:predicted transcriptional regulator